MYANIIANIPCSKFVNEILNSESANVTTEYGRKNPSSETYVYALQSLLAVVEEFVQFPAGSQRLCPRINQLQQVSPRLINAVLPFGNCGRIRVTGGNQLVTDVVDRSYTLLANHFRLLSEFFESVAQHLATNIN